MKHVKKIPGVALCLAMLMGALTVGAGAAFTDQGDIAHTEAVEACVERNIINGYPDGSYQPNGHITRAEMCKMICVALNGGREPTLPDSTAPVFTDTQGWAEKYIASCYSLGIVDGNGDGTFAPDQSVTGSQAAKMLLAALGYDAEREGFTGPMWAAYTNVAAGLAGLYQGVDADPSLALTRDSAAQMVWNTLNTPMVEYVTETVTVDGETAEKTSRKDKMSEDGKTVVTLMMDKY